MSCNVFWWSCEIWTLIVLFNNGKKAPRGAEERHWANELSAFTATHSHCLYAPFVSSPLTRKHNKLLHAPWRFVCKRRWCLSGGISIISRASTQRIEGLTFQSDFVYRQNTPLKVLPIVMKLSTWLRWFGLCPIRIPKACTRNNRFVDKRDITEISDSILCLSKHFIDVMRSDHVSCQYCQQQEQTWDYVIERVY